MSPCFVNPLICVNPQDVSCNELRALPASVGQLKSLRDLNLRRNQLTVLPTGEWRTSGGGGGSPILGESPLTPSCPCHVCVPPELSELPLVRLDFSCNRVVTIPRCYRRLRHLQIILADNNPLQSPPAQVRKGPGGVGVTPGPPKTPSDLPPQVCLKGKVHIFKYLHLEAEAATATRPPPTW